MGVRQKGFVTFHHILRELISLNEIWIEGIQNEKVILLRSIRKVGPVESIGHVHLIDTGV